MNLHLINRDLDETQTDFVFLYALALLSLSFPLVFQEVPPRVQ